MRLPGEHGVGRLTKVLTMNPNPTISQSTGVVNRCFTALAPNRAAFDSPRLLDELVHYDDHRSRYVFVVYARQDQRARRNALDRSRRRQVRRRPSPGPRIASIRPHSHVGSAPLDRSSARW